MNEPKIVASLTFTSFYVAFCESTFLRKELFYQTIYQNGYSSADRAIHGVEASKNSFIGEVEPCQTRSKLVAIDLNILIIQMN